MPRSPSSTGLREEMGLVAARARRRAILAFLALPILFAILVGFVLYLATHWPYPPGFEWISRWTPSQLFGVSLGLLVLFVAGSIVLAWKLSRRWLWESAVHMMELMEGTAEKGEIAAMGPPTDMQRLLFRVERALEKHRSASEGVKDMEAVRGAVGRLCEEIEQMGLRRFDRDFSYGKGVLAPLDSYLTECCAELSSYIDGCKSVTAQISETVQTARAQAAELSSQAERTFVGHGEISVGIRNFSKRVEEALRIVGGGPPEGGPAESETVSESLQKIDGAVDSSVSTVGRMMDLDEDRKQISSDSKRLADEATVIALNAAIEASKTGSKELESLADNARRLAEGSMAACEKVEGLSARYGDGVAAVTEALNGLRAGLAAWRDHVRQEMSDRARSSADLEKFLVSMRDFAASLAAKSEDMARLSEATSSQAQGARRATEVALSELEALMGRLGASHIDEKGSSTDEGNSSQEEGPTGG